MAFSNQTITAPCANKPHICKRAGLWRVSPYNHKRLWRLQIADRWEKAHHLTNRLNDEIRAEHESAKERQRAYKRRVCPYCEATPEYTHRDGLPVCKCTDRNCPGSDRWLEYSDFEEQRK